jgi:RNA polymerase sigma-70 factor, ECF subfamily
MVTRAVPARDAVDGALAAGRAAFPSVAAGGSALRARLERACAQSPDPAFWPQLFLASACAEGDQAAVAIFERRYISQVGRHLGRMNLTPAELDEIRQRLRISLLTGPNPGLGTFSGRAPLDAWVRVAAVRAALRHLSTERTAAEQDAAISLLLAREAESDNVVAGSVRAHLRAAIEEGLRQLPAHDKAVLRLHFLDGRSLDAVGAVYHVHRATVARWLVRIRARVFRAVRRRLALDLRPSTSELHSLVRLARQDLQVSLTRVLADTA